MGMAKKDYTWYWAWEMSHNTLVTVLGTKYFQGCSCVLGIGAQVACVLEEDAHNQKNADVLFHLRESGCLYTMACLSDF